jgi:hypothetical protein
MTLDPERLDELLAREPYLDDGGFTTRVMDRLPARRRDPRPLVLGLASAAAAVTALLVLPGAVQAGLQAVAAATFPAPVAPGLLLGAVAAGVAAAVAGLVVTLEG